MDIMNKIVALGDSIVKGVLLNKEENGKTHYELPDRNIIDTVAARTRSEVINLGKIGCTIAIGERILDRHISQLDGGQYAVLCYGGNDSDYNWRAIAQDPHGEHHPNTPLGLFEMTYARIINKVRQAGLTPVVMTLPPMDANRYFEFVTNGFNAQEKSNVLNWLHGSTDTIYTGHDLYNEAVKRVASRANALLVDVSNAFGNLQQHLCIDGIHPNLAGQARIAQLINKNI